MDILTLSLAVKKALAALGVKITPSEVLTWDGDFDDTEMILGALYACKITDKYMDLNSVESFVVKYDNGDTKTLTASECIVRTDTGMQILMSVGDETPYVFSSPADVEGMMNKGLYFTRSPEFYVEQITFAGTIHPIDQKYLPGVCLPVVELETVISIDSDETVLSAADAAKMDALNGHPCILKFAFHFLGAASTVRAVAGSFGIATSFSYQVATPYGNFDFTNIDTADGAWVCAKV